MSTSFSRRQSFRFVLALALAFTLAAGTWPRPQRAANLQVSGKSEAPAEVPAKTSAEIEQQAKEAYGKLGVSFEENRGQVDARVRFVARHGGATVYLTNEEVSFVLSAPETLARRGPAPERRGRPKLHAVRMKFEGANPRAEVSGERELEGKVNYFRGSDPSKWQTNVRTYGAVRYRGLYEGVDLVYYGNERGEMEYDFVVAPGADPRRISLNVAGAKALTLDDSGDLVIDTPAGKLRQRRPTVYQEVDGARREVAGRYVVEAGGRVRFKLGEYDRSAPLVIDPVLEYSTYLGGSGLDSAYDIVLDSAGNAYLTGSTDSFDFPTVNPIRDMPINWDVFVTKLNATGTALVYSTYLGGFGIEDPGGIALDSAGNACVTGGTNSAGFPLVNAVQGVYGGGPSDAFAAKLNAAGSAFIYSTYLGGSARDGSFDIAVDSSGSAYLTGDTLSTDFPTVNPIQSENAGGRPPDPIDGFVAKLDAAGSALVYSTYLGGSDWDLSTAIAVDSSGNIYLAGFTWSTDFPTADAIQSENRGGHYDAFVTKLNADGSAFIYSTFLGGRNAETGNSIAVDSSGSLYIVGGTQSRDFPVVNALQGAHAGHFNDGFVAKILTLPSIRGRVVTQGAAGEVGVPWATVKLTGAQTMTKLTDAHGYYSFTGLTEGGDYTVTPSKANLSFTPAVLTFTDLNSNLFDADIAVPSLSVNNIAVTEGDAGEATAAFTVSLQPASGETVTVSYRTTSGTFNPAAAGTDYTALPLTQVTFAPGETEKTVAVSVKGDARDEPNETLLLRLSAPANAVISDHTGVCTITDDDAAPSISVSDRRVTEPDAGTVNAAFTVTLSAASSRTVTVKFRTADGTAAAGADYAALDWTTLTFSPGQTIKYVTVKVNGDTAEEGNETFFVKLSAAVNASIADAQGLGKITDDD